MADKKLDKAAKAEARAQKRADRKARWKQLGQAFQIQRKQDKALIPILLATVVGITAVCVLIGYFWGGMVPLGIAGFILGITAALFVFTKRLEKTVYARAEGQPGAAAWALDNMKSGLAMVWKTKPTIAMNQQMDCVHRTVGMPGIILVGEGDESRVRPMMDREAKKLHRITPTTEIYQIMVGNGEGQIPIRKLQRELVRMPKALSKEEVYALAARLDSIDSLGGAGPQGMPKGPLPKGAKMSGMNRRARRNSKRG